MTRSVWVLLLGGVLLCGRLTCAATRRPAPPRVASQYTLSLRVSNSDLWLGPPAQGFAQATEVVVRVLDAQGQPVAEGLIDGEAVRVASGKFSVRIKGAKAKPLPIVIKQKETTSVEL